MAGWTHALLDLLLPVECAGCGAPGASWCPDCAVLLGCPVQVHPPCCSAAPGCPPHPPVYALGAYRGRLRTALLAYKEHGRRDLGGPLGGALAAALLQLAPVTGTGTGPESGGVCLVPVPSRRSAAAARGGQHVTLLAQQAAAALANAGMAAAVAPALRMAAGVRDSVGLPAVARQANLAGRVLLRRTGMPPAGMPVVLVDDVVTTGATVAACVAALLRAGVYTPAIVVLAAAGCHRPSYLEALNATHSVEDPERHVRPWRRDLRRTTVRRISTDTADSEGGETAMILAPAA
ncbi:MAG: ComF family protein [Pseudonocardiaceae bacterium]